MTALHRKLLGIFHKKSSQKGFTLIELLVVIGILGILAASLVATIDPFEQLKKASDANVKNILVEFLNATTRYYTTHNAYPWDTSAGGCNSGGAPAALTLGTGLGLGCVATLQADNELKSAFSSDTGDLNRVIVTYVNGNNENQTVGCFLPQSKSQQKDTNTKFDVNGNPTTGCASTSGQSGVCYWCTR